MRACNNLLQPPKNAFLYLQFLARCHPYILLQLYIMQLSATAAIYVNTALCVVMGVSASIISYIHLMYAIYTITIALLELELYLINESPRVIVNSVEAEFEVNGPVTGIRCVLRSQVDRLWKDCKTSLQNDCFSVLYYHTCHPHNVSSISELCRFILCLEESIVPCYDCFSRLSSHRLNVCCSSIH